MLQETLQQYKLVGMVISCTRTLLFFQPASLDLRKENKQIMQIEQNQNETILKQDINDSFYT